ncbi:MAG TPA: CdaR family protein [Desulfurivibrionaceae bacterium]|nr:CdaR family protein [Desulfurivibrionaceae bacterium]
MAPQIEEKPKTLSSPSWPRWPKDWLLRLLSLLLAVFLWYFVVGEDKVDTSIYIPVEIVNLPRELVIANQFKKQVEVSVSGPRGLIDSIRRQRINRTVNLAKAAPGTVVIRNEPESIPLPRGVNILRIQPTHITLQIDRLVEKTLPVELKITGHPAEGYELISAQVEPPIITISGPQATLGNETQLLTEPLDISGLDSSVTKQVPLRLAPAVIDLIGETVVSARVVVKEKTTPREFGAVPLTVAQGDPNLKYQFTPATVTVTAKVPLSQVHDPARLVAKIRATINVAGLAPGRHKLFTEVTAQEPLAVQSFSPKTVMVRVSPAKP